MGVRRRAVLTALVSPPIPTFPRQGGKGGHKVEEFLPRYLRWCGAQCHLETGATAVTRHTPHITAMVSGNLAD